MRCPCCGVEIALPRDMDAKLQEFLSCLKKHNNNTRKAAEEMGISRECARKWRRRIAEAPPPPTNKEIAMHRPKSPGWTAEEEDILLEWSCMGVSADEICEKLGRTKRAVASKLFDLRCKIKFGGRSEPTTGDKLVRRCG